MMKGVAVLPSLKRESGQTMAEYGVILAVISAAVLGALLLFSGAVRVALERTVDFLT
jgi:Flp pilus assembly pilin Flp